MANNEDYLDALIAYSKNPSREIPTILEQYLNGVAKNGETIFQWQLLKPLIVGKMDQVIEELRQKQSSENIPEIPNVEKVLFDVMHTRIMDAVHRFNGAPFTIQRLCELLIDPKQHYKRSDKFMRGLEKNVLVVSTVDPFGRKIVLESNTKHLFNGAHMNGSPFLPLDSNISSNLPPVPDWVMTTVSKTFPADSSEQKPILKQPSQNLSAEVSAGRLMNSVYPDHGEQSSVEQLEEVVEESVVIMDTNEAGTVATDGGEAMAEEDVDEEDVGESINTASSSTEELLTPAANESSLAEMTRVTSSSDNLVRPLADISNEENLTRKSTSFRTVIDSSQKSEKLFEFFSQDSSDNQKTFSSYLEVNSSRIDQSQNINDSLAESSPDLSLEVKSIRIDQFHDINDSLTESSSDLSVHQKTLDNGKNVHPYTAAMIETIVSQDDSLCDVSESNNSNISQDDSLCDVSESNNSNNINTLDIDSDNSPSGSDEFTPTSSVIDTPGHVEPHQTSSSPVHSYTDVSASLTTDPMSKNNVDLNSAEECDSVTNIEIIDNAAEATQSQISRSCTVPLCTPPSPTEIVQRNEDEQDTTLLSSSCDSCIDSEELTTKHSRMSDEAPSPSISSVISIVAPLEMTVSSSSDTHVSSDMIASSTSDSTSKLSAVASLDQTHEFLDAVSCSEKDTDFPANVNDIIQERVTELPPHLLSSNDIQGCDILGNIHHTNMTQEKQTEKILTQEATEVTTLIPECVYKQEPMEQD